MSANSTSPFRHFCRLSGLFSVLILPVTAWGAGVIWNPLEDRYDAQLANTVMIGPKGCVIDRVAKNTGADQVEAMMFCDMAETPELFALAYQPEDGWRVPTVGGGGGAGTGGFGGIATATTPTTTNGGVQTTSLSPTTGTSPTVVPTGTTAPVTPQTPIIPILTDGAVDPEDSTPNTSNDPTGDTEGQTDTTDGGTNDSNDTTSSTTDPTDTTGGGTSDQNDATGGFDDPLDIVGGTTETNDDLFTGNTGSNTVEATVPTVPLPAPLTALLFGLSALVLLRRR